MFRWIVFDEKGRPARRGTGVVGEDSIILSGDSGKPLGDTHALLITAAVLGDGQGHSDTTSVRDLGGGVVEVRAARDLYRTLWKGGADFRGRLVFLNGKRAVMVEEQ